MLKKKDIILFSSIILAALITLGVRTLLLRDTATAVTVTADGNEVYRGSLFENKTVFLPGNTIKIENGTVDVTEADCKNQICLNHSPISEKGESIICLPHKVIVEIE